MRVILVPILALFCVFGIVSDAVAGSYQGNGTYTGAPSAAVTALFAKYPAGGDALVNAIRELILANPALADDVAYVASRGSAAQQAAAAAGMAQAFTVLVNRGDNQNAARIVSAAQQSGSAVIRTAVSAAIGSSVGFSAFSASVNSPVISPAR